jgi:transcriptional regulator NrdR family protein
MAANQNGTHDFYCPICGNATLPVYRTANHQREKFHRKNLYCYHCKKDVTTVEIRNSLELEEFKKNFKNGVYANETQDISSYVRTSWLWKK